MQNYDNEKILVFTNCNVLPYQKFISQPRLFRTSKKHKVVNSSDEDNSYLIVILNPLLKSRN